MTQAYAWMKKEIKEAIPGLIYFIITFNLINLTERLMLRSNDIALNSAPISYLTATLGAMVLVKAMLIIDALTSANRFPNKPLIYNITWKVVIYAILTLIFRLLDIVIHLYFKLDNISDVWQNLLIRLTFPEFWAVELWLLMLFIAYFVASEFTRVLGKDKISQLLFGQPHN